jgi:hypothetical protein
MPSRMNTANCNSAASGAAMLFARPVVPGGEDEDERVGATTHYRRKFARLGCQHGGEGRRADVTAIHHQRGRATGYVQLWMVREIGNVSFALLPWGPVTRSSIALGPMAVNSG